MPAIGRATVDAALASLADEGFAVVPDALSGHESDRLYSAARAAFSRCEAAAATQFGAAAAAGEDTGCCTPAWLAPGGAQGYMGPGNPAWEQGMYRWVESAVNHDAALAVLCGHGVAVAVAEALMGADVRQSNGVGLRWCRPGDWSRPGGPQATLHADWPTAQMPEPWPEGCTGMMALFCLTDFTAQNGATRVIPFSQLARHRPGKACSYREHLEEPVEARRGSLLLFDSKLWHRVGPNTSAGSERLSSRAGRQRAGRFRARGTRGGRHVSGSRRAGGCRLSRPCSG